MSRGLGVDEGLAAALGPAEPLLALLTQLGDSWFLVGLGLVLYWLGRRAPVPDWDRRHGLLVVGIAVWAIAATYLLKVAFGLPRPPGAGTPTYDPGGPLRLVYAETATATGFGFPSGHATGAAAVYGVLAWLPGADGRPRRLAAAAALIALVGVTRIGLGLHYAVDVVAGVAVGLVLAAVALRWDGQPGTVLGLAIATATARVLVAPAGPRTAAILGFGVGAFLAWLWLGAGDRPAIGDATPGLVGLASGAAVAAGLSLAALGPVPAAVGLAASGGGLSAVGLPASIGRPEK